MSTDTPEKPISDQFIEVQKKYREAMTELLEFTSKHAGQVRGTIAFMSLTAQFTGVAISVLAKALGRPSLEVKGNLMRGFDQELQRAIERADQEMGRVFSEVETKQ